MKSSRFLAVACALTLSACGGSSSTSGPALIAEIPVPGLTNFDIGTVNSATGKYYLSDLPAKGVDIFDIPSLSLIGTIAAGAFAGDNTVTPVDGPPDHSRNGPNGIVLIPGTSLMYAGDINTIRILDTGAKAVVKSITVGSSGTRADEGCYDPDDGLVMFATPEASPPFATFISTATQTIVAQYVFSPDTQGLEQCAYDANSKSFIINNDGTNTNPFGEVDVFTAASVVAKAPAISKTFSLGNCFPAGLALGPNNDMVIGCNPPFAPGILPIFPQITLIMDRSNGTVYATVPFGGEDAVAYDPVSNRYFVAAFFHQANSMAGNPAAASPSLGIIDAATRTFITALPTGLAAHSIAVDGSSHKVFVPHLGGLSGFLASGVSVYSTN